MSKNPEWLSALKYNEKKHSKYLTNGRGSIRKIFTLNQHHLKSPPCNHVWNMVHLTHCSQLSDFIINI